MNDINQRIAELSPEQRAFLEARLMEKNAAAAIAAPKQTIARLPRKGDPCSFPLSFAQQRLWFLDQLEPGGISYNILRTIRLDGVLQTEALHQALNGIVARHETLRTRFVTVAGEPVQSIAAQGSVALPITDLSELSEAERTAETERLAAAIAYQSFDLATDPLLRTSLLRLGEQQHLLLLTMHHIISDAWSVGVFFKELAACYESFSTGRLAYLPELPIQYADFAEWQRGWLQGATLNEQLDYWKHQLQGVPARLELPMDRSRSITPGHQGARLTLSLPQSLCESLDTLNRRAGVTPFMTLLAVFKLLLSRYAGQEDIVLGSPIAGRTRIETEELIGFFINTLVLRTDISGNISFINLLKRVRKVALEAYAHQDLPFEKLVEELQPERGLDRNPLFDVMFNFINVPGLSIGLPGLTLSQVELLKPQSKFLMTLYARKLEDQLTLELVYKSDLFSAERMNCLLRQFVYLLEQVVADPERDIQSYSLITPEARAFLPDPAAPLPEPYYDSITSTFLSWAARAPQYPAICQADKTWTYAELAQQAQTLARVLLAQGLTRGDVVALMGPRSFGLIAGMLAVFLSGGVMLTVDSTLPSKRQRLMLEQAGAKRILYFGDKLTNDAWVTIEFASVVITRVDADTGIIIDADTVPNLDAIDLPEPAPDDPAYIFFTSGTTGIPKGILGCHKGLNHLLHWQRETFAVGPDDRCAQLIGLSFDAILRDIFLPLTSGASLHLPEAADDLGPVDIIPWLKSERITLFTVVPTLAQSWLADLSEDFILDSLRWIIFTGEPLTDLLVQRWRTLLSDKGAMANFYGPTETTLIKCCYMVPVQPAPGVQPIGLPLPETQVLILGKNNRLCGVGEAGEIAIRTPFRTLGYINLPEETSRCFVKNPFRNDNRDLIYYTGDRGRYRPDGIIEILGRLDDQVKIRGVRIEPGEITSILLQHSAVNSCAVLAQKDEQGISFLVAYVVADEVAAIPELRTYLGKLLPAAMVPAAFVMLDALPLTSNGKLDRRALPVPGNIGEALETAFIAPRTPVEETLAAIWSDVLKRQQIGIHDNFFDLGGHSLLATQVISRIRHTLKIELPLMTLFEEPTVAGLAAAIAQRQIGQGTHDEVDRLLTELEGLSEQQAQAKFS